MSNDIVCYYDGDAYNGGFTSLNTTLCDTSVSGAKGACCYGGNRCLKDSICYAVPDESEITGYYVAGCTDPTFNDPSCASHCATFSSTDIVYNSTTEEWACCHASLNSKRNCSTPSNETFSAPAPSELKALASASRTATASSSFPSSSAFSDTTTSSASFPTSETTSSSSGSALSQAALAGIILGVTLVGFVILLGVVLIIRRRTARRRRAQAIGPPGFAAQNASYTPLDTIRNSGGESFATYDTTRHSMMKPMPGGGAYTTINQSHDHPPMGPEEMDGTGVWHGPVEMSADSRVEMEAYKPPARGERDA